MLNPLYDLGFEHPFLDYVYTQGDSGFNNPHEELDARFSRNDDEADFNWLETKEH